MKMESTISERDKKLLIFLGLFVVVVAFGYWGIRPIAKSISEINDEIEDEEFAMEMEDLKLMELPMLRVDNEKFEEDIKTARENYYPIMSSDEIDKYFTGIALDYKLYAYDMAIDISDETTNLAPYQYSEKALNPVVEEPLEEEIFVDDEVDEKSDKKKNKDKEKNKKDKDSLTDLNLPVLEEQEVGNGIYEATVQMRFGGDYSQLRKFIDDFSNTNQKLRIQNYYYSKETEVTVEAEDTTYEVKENWVLFVTVQIYMCEE